MVLFHTSHIILSLDASCSLYVEYQVIDLIINLAQSNHAIYPNEVCASVHNNCDRAMLQLTMNHWIEFQGQAV